MLDVPTVEQTKTKSKPRGGFGGRDGPWSGGGGGGGVLGDLELEVTIYAYID